jgi:hypothetical protein
MVLGGTEEDRTPLAVLTGLSNNQYTTAPDGSCLEAGTTTKTCWSGRRDSNSRLSAWKAEALPLSYDRVNGWLRRKKVVVRPFIVIPVSIYYTLLWLNVNLRSRGI